MSLTFLEFARWQKIISNIFYNKNWSQHVLYLLDAGLPDGEKIA